MSNLKLSIVMAVMASLSTAMLGMGQGSVVLPAMTLMAAVTSVVFTDLLGWFYLNRIVANLAMLLAAFFSLYGFLESGSQQQLWAIANLLTYVQLVLLFQAKNRRVYGQLAMFSLLQVVVAALLNSGMEFGLLLGLYMVIALFGFVLFFIYREVGRVGMVVPRRRWFQVPPPAPDQLEAEIDGQPVIQVVERGTALNRRIVSRRIAQPVLAIVSATALFTVVFFYATPRTGGSNWERGLGGRSLVGFSPEVSFDQMGQLLANPQRVMRVSFTHATTGQAYTVIGEPYLRGVVLTKYVEGQWREEIPSGVMPRTPLESPPNVRDLVKQDILLEPRGDRRLFSMFPVYRMAQTSNDLRIEPRRRFLMRTDLHRNEDNRDEYRYTVVTTAFRYGSQLPVIPHHSLETVEERQNNYQWLNMRHIDSEEKFPGLIALAQQIVNEKAPQGNNYERARALETFFLDDKSFQYSLDMNTINARRTRGVDPVEDFVTNHRMGHCEYFASALTLMLRSQNIEARMVIGYRPSEFNYVGNYYIVRQSDAHAWVEAFLRPDEIPDGAMYREEQHAGGGWLRLDPTPADSQIIAGSQRDLLDRASKSFDYAQWLWSDYVLRLTEQRQREAVLNPLSLDHEISMSNIFSAETWKALAQRTTGTSLSGMLQSGFNWRGGVAAIVACVLALLAYRTGRYLLPRIPRLRFALRRRIAPLRRRKTAVAFYQRFETALARIGLQRHAAQTQRQFAGQAAAQLGSDPAWAAAADVPHQIVDAFYQVRFGHREPNAREEAEISAQLARLEDLLG